MATSRARILEKVRALCLAFPEVNERPSHGSPTWFIRDKKTFASFVDDHHGDGRLALWVACTPEEQALLLADNPAAYFYPPYVGHRGWIGVQLDKGLGWDEVAEVLDAGYRLVAPKKLVAELDARASS